jgi:hypothetical protein
VSEASSFGREVPEQLHLRHRQKSTIGLEAAPSPIVRRRRDAAAL